MINKEALKRVHIKSWEILGKELILGKPFWLEFLTKAENLIKLYPTQNIPPKILYDPKKERLSSFSVVQRIGGHINAYLCGTVIPKRVLKKYTEKELFLGIFHENFHNCLGEVNPTFHAITRYWKGVCEGKEKYYGELIINVEDRFAFILAKKLAKEFGISDEEASKITIRGIKDYRNIPYRQAIKILDKQEKELDEIGIKELVKDPLHITENFLMKYYGLKHNFYESFKLYEKMINQVYKRDINSEWTRIK